MSPEQITQLKKLQTFKQDANFAIFGELQGLNDSIKALIEATKSSKTEEVSVTNLGDAKTDLSPLEHNFEALKASVESVTEAIKAIPEDKEINMSGVEKLLSQIANKPVEKMDMSHMEAMTSILDEILFAVQTTASHVNDKEENPADKIVPELKSVQEILNLINENIVSIDIPSFDYLKLAEIIRKNVKISGGGGPSVVRATIQNAGVDVSVATEATLSSINTKTPALGQTTMSASLPVTIASDQSDIVAMSRVHKKVHEGRFFSGGCNNLALANNGVLEMLIQTGVQQIHMVFSCDVSGDATAALYEGATFSNAGTTVNMSNHNRPSANAFVGTVTHTPTLTADGTQINGTDFMPGGTKGSGSGSSSQSFAEEFILADNTNYLIRLTNISGGVGKFDIHLAAYQPNL